jgi:hypothetical protein
MWAFAIGQTLRKDISRLKTLIVPKVFVGEIQLIELVFQV